MAGRIINSKLFAQAKGYLVGGVNSPVRDFHYAGGGPLLIKKGRGSKIYDYDGNRYIDYVLSWGSLILGHAFPKVINKIRIAARSGLSFGITSAREIKLAKLICGAIPFIDKVRLVNSGTEALMGAIRLARGYTGRNKIIKFEHAYHGHADYLLVAAGSGLATLSIPQSQGIPGDFIKHTLVLPYGDTAQLGKIFKKYGKEIAAVLVEPVGGNYGVIAAEINFLRRLGEITGENGSMLIADEVITGFRFNFGSFMHSAGITPDLICLGKIIGGGLPIGAYAGKRKIMDKLAPLGKVYQASTFAGNPIVMEAGIATLRALAGLKDKYRNLEKLALFLSAGLARKAKELDIGLEVSSFGSMFSLKFAEVKVFKKFYKGMLEGGVCLAPSEFEANFLSFAHTQKDIDKTVALAEKVLTEI